MFLSKDQIIEMTGYKYTSRQIKWLKDHRVPFTLKATGKPNVLVDDYYKLYGISEPRKRAREPKLNLAAFQSR